MSHVVIGKSICSDIEVLKLALKLFPLMEWKEGQTSYAWYKGGWQNDYSKEDAAYRNGVAVDDYGKCSHAIRMPGSEYEVGVVDRKDGKGFSLVWDFFSSGRKISEYIGSGAEKLMTEYNRIYCEQYAQAEGMMTSVNEDNESITIEMFT